MNVLAPPIAGLLVVLSAAATALPQKTPDEAMAALRAGNERFSANRSVAQPLGEGTRRTLARGQCPFAIVLCCADSRVPPEHVFNVGLGELFVVRMAGPCADAEAIASIEYAAEHLGTQLCVVLGHESCDAVAAAAAQLQSGLVDRPPAVTSPAVRQLLEQIEPSVRRALSRDFGGKALCDQAEEENAQHQAREVLRRSPLLRHLERTGRFQVAPARYRLETGAVEWLPRRPLPPEAAETPTAAVPAGMPPHLALRMLQAGHRRFLSDARPVGDIGLERRKGLTFGQQALAIVVTCSDSRVAPEHLFDAGLGELFVVRVAGNAIDDDVLASVEFAAAHTGASLVLVMGHTKCGAVTAAASEHADHTPSANLQRLLDRLAPAVALARGQGRKGDDLVAKAIECNAMRTAAQLRAQSRTLRDLEQAGRLAILSAVYDLGSGNLEWLREAETPAAAPAAPAPAGEVQAGTNREHGHESGKDHASDWHDEPQPSTPARGHAPRSTAATPPLDQAAGHGRGDDRRAPVDHAAGTDHAGSQVRGASWLPERTWLIGIGGIVSLLFAALLVQRARSR